ncbi:MAG: polysaccharide biosynthesis C-terminal domain-containing protein [Bacteroidia bacterium]
MSGIKQLFGQTGIYGLGNILPRFLNYLLTPLYTYLFTNPADYGINAEVYAYISFLNIIFTYGMETAYFHFVNKSDEPQKILNNSLSLILLTTTFFSLMLLLFSSDISKILNYQNNLFVIWTIGIIATDAVMSIPFAYIRQQQKPLYFSIIKISNVLINILLNLFFFLVCKKEYDAGHQNLFSKIYSPEIGIGYSFLSNLLSNVFSIIMLFPVWKNFHLSIDWKLSKKMLNYALPLLIVGLAGMINETFDRIVLKYLLPLEVAQSAQGIYGACYKISILMTIFIQSYRYAAEPFFFKTFKNNDAKKMYALSTDVFIAFGLIIWLGTLINLPIIQYFIGPSYRIGLKVVPILLTANLCLGIYFNLSFWYKLTGLTQIGAYVTLFGAFITLLINFIFVPEYSYVASAYATLAAYGSMMLVAYFLGQKYFKIDYPYRRIFSNACIAFLIYFVSIQLFHNNHHYQLIVGNLFLILFIVYLFKKYHPIIQQKN